MPMMVMMQRCHDVAVVIIVVDWITTLFVFSFSTNSNTFRWVDLRREGLVIGQDPYLEGNALSLSPEMTRNDVVTTYHTHEGKPVDAPLYPPLPAEAPPPLYLVLQR